MDGDPEVSGNGGIDPGFGPDGPTDDAARWDAFVDKMVVPTDSAVETPMAEGGSSRRRKIVAGAAVVIIAAASAAGVISFAGGPGTPGGGQTPASFVFSSTQSTLGQRTADVVFGGAITAAGKTVPLQGTGQADFSTGDFSGNLTLNASGLSILEKELVVGGHFYLGLVENGTDISSVTSGKHWVEIPLPSGTGAGSVGLGSVDPISQLQLIEKKGAGVAPLGSSVIDGVTTSGFSITPSKQEIEQQIEKESTSAGVTPAFTQQALTFANSVSSFTFDVWFDGTGLLRRETVDLGTTGANGFSGKVDVTFEHYGTAVALSPPAASDVIGYQDFVGALQSGTPAG